MKHCEVGLALERPTYAGFRMQAVLLSAVCLLGVVLLLWTAMRCSLAYLKRLCAMSSSGGLCPKRHLPLLLVALCLRGAAASSSSTTFATKAELVTAVDAWCTSAENAAATYGDIANWDVSGVTDMSYLFCGYLDWQDRGCRATVSTCNPDVSTWDVSSVTNMDSMVRHLRRRPSPCPCRRRLPSLPACGLPTSPPHLACRVPSSRALTPEPLNRPQFDSDKGFTSDLSAWDVSRVTNMNSMVRRLRRRSSPRPCRRCVPSPSQPMGCRSRLPLALSRLSRSISRPQFWDAIRFTSDLSAWDVSSVIGMPAMVRRLRRHSSPRPCRHCVPSLFPASQLVDCRSRVQILLPLALHLALSRVSHP